MLKRGGGSSSSRSSSSKSSSYGNCYGDRCDNNGGDVSIAVIIGIVVGGCFFLCLIYVLYQYCKAKIKKNRKKARKIAKVGPNGEKLDSSDSDMPKEPKVIYGNAAYSGNDMTDVNNNSRMEMVNPYPNFA